ncbi:DUF397 domain-containing protein [Amycolatopsis thailandensis]|uniref:DUF397 domain-containing protein n=1 Tax=Amycolatopsis thailandensis TaxID=589330 RepID=UPI0037A96C97
MTVPDDRQPTWRKSTKSATQSDCVEVDMDDPTRPTVGIRDSKDPDGGQLRVSPAMWSAFTQAVKRTP